MNRRSRSVSIRCVLLVLSGSFAVAYSTPGVGPSSALTARENIAGLRAKVLCSEVYVAGRDAAHVQSIDLASPNLHEAVGDVSQVLLTGDPFYGAEATVAGVSRRAVHREGYGCALLPVGFGVDDLWMPSAEPPRVALRVPDDELKHAPASRVTAALSRIAAEAVASSESAVSNSTRAVLIVQGGKILAEAYADGFDQRSRFASYSMGKALTNALIGRLVNDGSLSLDSQAVVSEWRTGGDGRSEIRIRDLLQMTAGLDGEFEGRRAMGSPAMSALFGSVDSETWATGLSQRTVPGESWWYSNANTFVLLRVLREIVSEEPAALRAFIESQLFAPLNMRDSVIEFNAFGTPVTTSFNYVSARDWARFGQLYLDDGVSDSRRLLPEGWVEFTTRPAAASLDRTFGAHFHVNAGLSHSCATCPPPRPGLPPIQALPNDAFFALGDSGQSLTMVPSLDLIIVRLGQIRPTDSSWDFELFLGEIMRALQA